jgi:hypothetical protein
MRTSTNVLTKQLVTHSNEQSPSWEANGHSDINAPPPSVLWNTKVHYRVHRSPQVVIPSNFDPLYNIS